MAQHVTIFTQGGQPAEDVTLVRVAATADGDNVVVAGVPGKRLRVLGYTLTVTAAGIITIQDTQATPTVFAQLSLPANGVVSYAGGLDAPAFETDVGNGLEINLPTNVDCLGHLTYTVL